MPIPASEPAAVKRPPLSEHQELMALVTRSFHVIADLQVEIAALRQRQDVLEERLAMAAGQYRQRVMGDGQ